MNESEPDLPGSFVTISPTFSQIGTITLKSLNSEVSLQFIDVNEASGLNI